ncbi:Bombyxin F-1 like protein [Argiope bruennichi]|uniref:Bombyxin F-1 like protein n=1 Tax=Argiope bruennichi TaxID=94029 RepID=A0A8T0EDY7_ARGBR|nr:Bombyxin F-1 like protein [Argiope bruennichi]
MLKIALLLLALAVIQFSQGSSSMEKNRRVKRGSTIRMCGKNLVQTLSLFCNGEYYDPNENSNVQTRDVRYSLEDPIQIWIATTLSSIYRDEASSKTVPEHIPTSHLFKRYGQGGIVDECCRKACTPSVLLSYCRHPN